MKKEEVSINGKAREGNVSEAHHFKERPKLRILEEEWMCVAT